MPSHCLDGGGLDLDDAVLDDAMDGDVAVAGVGAFAPVDAADAVVVAAVAADGVVVAAVDAAGAGAIVPVPPAGPWSRDDLVSSGAMTLASELAKGRYFAENGSAVSCGTVTNFNEVACGELVQHGIVDCRVNGVGELTLALRLNAVQLTGQILVTNPLLVANAKPVAKVRKIWEA